MAEEGSSSASGSAPRSKEEEIASRSVYVGNVNYQCTSEEVGQHFQDCGLIERVTIPEDKYGSKGYAYVEFADAESVENALRLNETVLRGRQLKVSAKRTYVPRRRQMRRPSADSHARGRPLRFGRQGSRYKPY